MLEVLPERDKGMMVWYTSLPCDNKESVYFRKIDPRINNVPSPSSLSPSQNPQYQWILPSPNFKMPVEVSQRPNETSKVTSHSSTSSSTNASSNSSSDDTIQHPSRDSRQSLETPKPVNESQVISPPSPKAPGNSSTEPSNRSTPLLKAPKNSTNPSKRSSPPPSTFSPQNSSPPTQNLSSPTQNSSLPQQNSSPPSQNLSPPPPSDDAPLLPPPPRPPDLPKRSPPPKPVAVDSPPSVTPPPPISKNELHPSPPDLSPPPFSKTRDSPPSPLLPPPPPPPLLSPPSTSGGPVSPTPPLLSLISSPHGTSLVPPQNPSNYNLNNAREHSNSDGYGIGTGGAVGIGLAVSFLLLGSIGITIWCLCWRKNKYSRQSNYLMPTSLMSSPSSDSELLKMQHSPSSYDYPAPETSGYGNLRSMYTYKELSKATNQFSKKNLLGEGGFGLVYKGHFPDGREIAVKQLKEGGGQGEREFRAEVETISHIHHKHLVALIGYCICKSRRLLVYDFVPNNTLHFHLHENGEHVLDWAARFKIAIGTARGIAYLHEDCHPRIIHRDIKSSNILIDNNFVAQVSDFGLARLFSDTYTHVTTRVMGTFGYMAPEYALSGKLTDKSDVFSFGVVLLELITGRKPVDSSQPSGKESLVEWARPLLNIVLESEEFEALVDPRLENSYVDSEMFCVIEAAASCVRHLAPKRPKMIQVVRAFDSVVVVKDLSNGMRVGESKIFDSTQESAEFRLLQNMAFGGQNYSSSSYTCGT